MVSVDESAYQHGLALFNAAKFFEAHEVLEDVWRASSAPEKQFLQGLIQAAVALHHHRQGNIAGARSLLRRAERNLAEYPEAFGGIDLGALRRVLAEWLRALQAGSTPPAPPKILYPA